MRCLPVLSAALLLASTVEAQAPANVIVFLADDLGYADVGPFDHDLDPLTPEVTNTPVLDQLAAEGVRLTSFYANSPVCSPTRAALLTGRHSIRSDITHVFKSGDPKGLPAAEVTLAEMLEPLGYRSGIVGKWHLGEPLEFLPLQQGFDEFYGVPFSNNAAGLYLLRGNTVVSTSVDQTQLTQDFTREAELFIDSAASAGDPFFLYVAYTAPHVPLFVSPAFRGVTARGLYADCVYELDDSIGRILARLDLHGLADDTLVVFTSDNGACNNSVVGPDPGAPGAGDPERWACGSNLPYAGFKFGFLEGGLRVPCIARWPGVLPAGVDRDTVASVLDLLPTVAAITGATPPLDRPLDGEDLFGVLTVDAPRALDELHFYALYQGAQWGTRTLACTRGGAWKQFYSQQFAPQALFNLELDPGETTSTFGPPGGTLWDRSRDFDCTLDEGLAFPSPVNLASLRTTHVSSSTGCETSSRAVDSDPSTQWHSAAGSSQSLALDLGSAQPLQRVILEWGADPATQYELQTSSDGVAWQTVFGEDGGNGGRDIVAVAVTTRYLQVECLAGPGVGFGLRELRIQAAKLPDVPSALK